MLTLQPVHIQLVSSCLTWQPTNSLCFLLYLRWDGLWKQHPAIWFMQCFALIVFWGLTLTSPCGSTNWRHTHLTNKCQLTQISCAFLTFACHYVTILKSCTICALRVSCWFFLYLLSSLFPEAGYHFQEMHTERLSLLFAVMITTSLLFTLFLQLVMWDRKVIIWKRNLGAFLFWHRRSWKWNITIMQGMQG